MSNMAMSARNLGRLNRDADDEITANERHAAKGRAKVRRSVKRAERSEWRSDAWSAVENWREEV